MLVRVHKAPKGETVQRSGLHIVNKSDSWVAGPGEIEITPAQFVSSEIKIPTPRRLPSGEVIMELKNFSFKGRPYLYLPYNIGARKVLLMCGRQVEKSTLLGNLMLSYMFLRRYFRCLFVTPTEKQTTTFSQDRITTPIGLSDALQAIATGHKSKVKDNVLYKKFVTHSDITFRYAFLNADRIRGVSADLLLLDELQDILTEVIPVIEQALSHSHMKWFRYSGTPKSFENTISHYWEKYSTQNEWVIPCDSCGSKGKSGAGRYWNVAGMRNIGLRFLVCSRCGSRIFPEHPDATWAAMNPKPEVPDPFVGFRIPQLITPWVGWSDILANLKVYSPAKFYNEVLGRAYDTGERPLTRADVIKCCVDSVSISKPGRFNDTVAHYAGIDWGTAENSYTVITIGGYYGDKFRVVYAKRLEGVEADPEATLRIINELITKWRVKLIGVDYGGGFDRNTALTKLYGAKRVVKYQYTNPSEKVRWEPKLGRFVVRRTEVLYDVISAVKRGDEFEFPNAAEWMNPFGTDMTNVVAEFNEARNQEVLNKVPGTTDDTLHSLVYLFLVSMLVRPRPDIITPGLPS